MRVGDIRRTSRSSPGFNRQRGEVEAVTIAADQLQAVRRKEPLLGKEGGFLFLFNSQSAIR
jgi:hypothetical protein